MDRIASRWGEAGTSRAMTRYRLMPEGKPLPIESAYEMNGSMLVQQVRIRTWITYTDHHVVSK